MNMMAKANEGRTYPDINVGDKVKILLKYDKFHKKHMPKFSDNKYDVKQIIEKYGLKVYMVNNRLRLRNEIMLV